MSAQRILLLFVLLAAAAPASAQADTVDMRRTVSVGGASSQLVENDAARLSLGVRATRTTAGQALRAASREMQRVIGAVRSTGVAPADILTREISVTRLSRRRPDGRPRKRRYNATQAISVVVRDVTTTGELVDRAVGAGATDVDGPEFFVSETARSYRDALALAFDDARAKAQLLADRAGAKLGPALSISEGVTQVAESQSASANDSVASAKKARQPPTPSRQGQSRVEATVSVVFELVV